MRPNAVGGLLVGGVPPAAEPFAQIERTPAKVSDGEPSLSREQILEQHPGDWAMDYMPRGTLRSVSSDGRAFSAIDVRAGVPLDLGTGTPLPLPPRSGKVVSVYDGDTFTIEAKDGNKVRRESVRVRYINCPERKPPEAFWEEGQQYAQNAFLNKMIALDFDEDNPRDKYGRVLGSAATKAEGDLATNLLERGLAHILHIPEAGKNPDLTALFAAQERARAKGIGIWSLDRYKSPITITSFKANAQGDDRIDPNGEYFRVVNIHSEAFDVGGLTVTNARGKSFVLPKLVVPPGHTVMVLSGKGADQLDPSQQMVVHLGSDWPIWDNDHDVVKVSDQSGKVLASREHKEALSTEPVTIEALVDIARNHEVKYILPEKLDLKVVKKDDGDTLFVPMPKTGVFKVEIDGLVVRPIKFTQSEEAPVGMIGARMLGVDTPETAVPYKKDNKTYRKGQGAPGKIATVALEKILANGILELLMNAKRPFDRYSRLLVDVEVTKDVDGKKVTINANERQVETGMGEMLYYYEPGEFDLERFKRFSAASKAAFEEGRGIYGKGEGRCEQRPAEFRREVQGHKGKRPMVIDMATRQIYDGDRWAEVPVYRRLFVSPDPKTVALATKELKLTPAPAKGGGKSKSIDLVA